MKCTGDDRDVEKSRLGVEFHLSFTQKRFGVGCPIIPIGNVQLSMGVFEMFNPCARNL